MRAISLIVVHCSATREDKSFTEHDLDVCHRRRGFNGVGYHFYIRKNGDIKSTRPLERIGAHAVASTVKVSVSAMRAVWTARDIPKTPGHRGRNILCVCLS